MEGLGIGIIGTGSIVDNYVKCIRELDEAKLIACYTESSTRKREAETLFGVDVYDDLQEFLGRPDIDLICVCNKSGLHGEVIIQSAEAGKHILCEKPLEITTDKVDEVIASCKLHKVVLGCVLQNRCTPEYKAVEHAVKSGKLGRLLLGNANINWYRSHEYYKQNPWRGTLALDGGAALMNQGIHTIDLLINLMGDVKSVFGNMKTWVHDIEGEDVGVGILNFYNGATGTITASTALFPGYPERLEVYGEKGSILMEGGKIKAWNIKGVPHPEDIRFKEYENAAADPTKIGYSNHKIVLKDIIAAIRKNETPMVDGATARKAVEVITKLYRSSKEERLVYL